MVQVSGFRKHLKGEGLRSRALRGTAIALGGTAGQQGLRLIANLVLTRLLFPEAFGLMALIQTFMIGLQMFSDIGIRPSIIQNRRGEDPAFLNTAWTIQVGRGIVLWLGACALAFPLAHFYGEPQIRELMPAVGLSALISGFTSTKVAVANRQIRLGRQTVIGLVSQVIGLVAMIGFAWIWPSVWALVVGSLISTAISVLAGHMLMPGIPNRLYWDRSAAIDLIRFGRFIFVSTIAGFFVNQGDKLVLGKLMTFSDLGVYNIGFFMSVFPAMLGQTVAEKILFPLYREKPPSQAPENLRKIRRARELLTGGMLLLLAVLAIGGNWLVGLLYDPRYAGAGPILIVLSLMQMLNALTLGNGHLLLAEGNSRDFSRLVILRGVLKFIIMFAAFWFLGLFGVLLTAGLLILITYPLQQFYLSRHKGMDLRRDALFAVLGIGLAVLAVWFNWEVLSEFVRASRAAAPAVTGSWQPAALFH